MNQLIRSTCPVKLDDAQKMSYYQNLYDSNGKIRPRWNTLQLHGKKEVREALASFSNNNCCFCGEKVFGSEMDVDHYLPTSRFPYLAYCWENLLPSCKRCNQAYKRDFLPLSLKDKVVIEACMQNELECDLIYDKHTIMDMTKEERIIDPTFDVVDDHIVFNPEFYFYEDKTSIGRKTIEMFFNRDEVVRRLESISLIVKGLVSNGCGYERVEDIISTYGQEFYYRAFYQFWMNEKAEGRLR